MSGLERRLLLEAWLRLAWTWFVVRGLGQGGRWLRCYRVPGTPRRATDGGPEAVAQACVLAARHHVLPQTCLTQALALAWMLDRRGYGPVVQVGVGPAAATALAHSWVELQGKILGSDPLAKACQIFQSPCAQT